MLWILLILHSRSRYLRSYQDNPPGIFFIANLKFQMTIFSITSLLLNLINGYSILHNIKVANGLILDSNLIFSIVVPLTLLIFLILTIYKSVECMSEIEETSNIVSKIFNLKLNLELEEMFRTFSCQIFHRSRKVRSGFFVIDWTLLQKVWRRNL